MESFIQVVLGFCTEVFLRIEMVFLKEELMALSVDQKWPWVSLKRKLVGAIQRKIGEVTI